MISPAALFTDFEQINIVDKQKAELYMQIYQYAAEDFLTTADANTYSMLLTEYFINIETQLTRLFSIIATHNHMGAHGPTSPPLNGAACSWTLVKQPKLVFTSGVKPNLYNNMVIYGTAMEGAPSFGLRRSMPVPLVIQPSVPPLITSSLKGIL